MTNYIVLGNWQVRHDEVVPLSQRKLYFVELPETENKRHKTILFDISSAAAPLLDAPQGDVVTGLVKANLCEAYIPLSVVSYEDGHARISHLVHRIEIFITHFYQLDALPVQVSKNGLFNDLSALYRENYLYLNNFECFYEKGIPDTELEQKFSIKENYNFYEMNERFYTALTNGEIKDFRPHLGDEIEHWSYDNDFFEIAPNEKKIAGYVSVMHWSRKKKVRFDEPVVTFKKKLYQEDALERWERNYHFQQIETTPEAALRDFFQLPLSELPSWRRVRLDIACEHTPTGDIYMLNFEDCRLKDVHEPQGRLQQCEIEYLKTRGKANEENIYQGFNALVGVVENFISDQGLSFEKNHYSKLTFLKDYMAFKAGQK